MTKTFASNLVRAVGLGGAAFLAYSAWENKKLADTFAAEAAKDNPAGKAGAPTDAQMKIYNDDMMIQSERANAAGHQAVGAVAALGVTLYVWSKI